MPSINSSGKQGIISEYDELEMVSLQRSAENTDTPVTTLVSKIQFRWQHIILIALLAGCSIGVMFKDDLLGANVHTEEIAGDVKAKAMITTSELLANLIDAKKDFHELLERDYGDYTDILFSKSNVVKAFAPFAESHNQLKTRMKIKVIEAQLLEEQETKFTWVTGGHSAAAGHGNMFNQTYSAALEAAAAPFFASVGINFLGKNHAMGGAHSAPELALCMSAVYGNDVDALSWDFGMTDGKAFSLYALWVERAGMLPSSPILFDFYDHKVENNKAVESGLAAIKFNVQPIRDLIPDSETSPVSVQESLPPAIKYLLCSKHVEQGGECNTHKFDTMRFCGKIKSQVGWHPGWKNHLLIGRVLAAYLVETLFEAVSELESDEISFNADVETNLRKDMDEPEKKKNAEDSVVPSSSLTHDYLQYLKALEAKNRAKFLASPVSDNLGDFSKIGTENYRFFQRNNVLCHTAILPARARYDGLVTESGTVGTYQYAGLTKGYDKAISPQNTEYEAKEPMLTQDVSSHQQCKYQLDIDFKDYFLVREKDGWLTSLVPNNAENKAFSIGDDWKNRQGMIMLCSKLFDWGHLPRDFVGIDEVDNTVDKDGNKKGINLEITINGVKVTKTDSIAHWNRCHVLSHEGGYSFPKSEKEELKGQYEISFKVLKKDGHLYLSSLIVI